MPNKILNKIFGLKKDLEPAKEDWGGPNEPNNIAIRLPTKGIKKPVEYMDYPREYYLCVCEEHVFFPFSFFFR